MANAAATNGIDELLPDTEAWAQDLGISREAVELYRTSEVVDLHVDTFIWWRIVRYDLHRRHGLGLLGGRFLSQLDIPRALEAGMKSAIWVITTNPFKPAPLRRRAFVENLRNLKALLAADPRIELVRTAAEHRAARARGKHAAFLGIQGGNAFSRLEDFDLIGDDEIVRITLVHLSNSVLGGTSAPSPRREGARGLTSYGRDYVRRMNEKKILVDLAHISREGFFDAVAVHDRSQPLVVTHTGVDAVHPHWRNVTDAQLGAVAETGGTVGVMFQRSFLGAGEISARTVVDHIEHIVKTVGEDHASIGSDYDGAIIPPADLSTPYGLPRLVQVMLDRGFSDTRVRKILGGNFLRVVEAVRG